MSLSPITINAGTIKQPTTARDYRINIQNDNQAIDGGMQRNRVISAANPVGYKYAVDLVWEDLGISDFQTLLGFFSSGSGVVYSNPNTKYGVLTYSGLPTVQEPDPYIPGDSLLTKFMVTIRQV
jgi:hypothetical protein